MSFFFFGGEFPGDEIIARLYIVHVLLIPGILLALVALHLIILWYQKHTHWGGAGKTEHNVVGPPFFPIYVAKAGGFQFIVWGVIAAMGAFIQINPVWIWGPYSASEVSAGTQPDWYMGWLDGLLRIMPNWETHWFGFTWSWNIIIPAQVVPGILIGVLLAYPWIEQFVTGDRREHHTLQRPRNQPVRTGLIAALATFIILGLFGGGNDFIALIFHVPINTITWALRILIFVGPVIAFYVTKRICLGLQRRDREMILHGYETGVVQRLPHGEFVEVHGPLGSEEAYVLASHPREVPHEVGPATDERGIPAPNRRVEEVRAKLSEAYYGDVVQKPTVEEYDAAQRHHAVEELEAGGEDAGEAPDEITRGH